MKYSCFLFVLLLILTGCSSFHSHDWLEANYQQPSTCSICGQTRGLPLEADFTLNDIDSFIHTGESKPYTTICDEEPLETTGLFTVVSHNIIPSDDSHKAINGYLWHVVTMTIDMDDANSNEHGFRYNYFITDYYDISSFELSYHSNESSSNSFTVNYNGKDYSECICRVSTTSTNWTKKTDEQYTKTVTIVMNILIPEHYDGIVVGVRNSGLDTTDKYLFNEYYSQDDFILYRLED